MTEFCTKCKEIKPMTDFYRSGEGLTPHCKSCFKRYYEENKSRRQEYQRKYYEENKAKRNEYQKDYRKSHKDEIRCYYRKYKKDRYAEDLDFRIRCTLRSRLANAIKHERAGSAMKDLGCSLEQLKHSLVSKFQPSMSWKNYGEWHIDHIIPLSSFDLTDRDQFLKAVHYTNLQPLWEEENIRKGNEVSFST